MPGPKEKSKTHFDTFKAGDLEATIIDNTSHGEHLKGLNGIAKFTSKHESENIYMAQSGGFNLEHIFSGDTLESLFEPRLHPMEFKRMAENSGQLTQSPTPLSKVSSETTFSLLEPYYMDVQFKCQIHDLAFFRHGYAGFFWASYINHPEDRSIHFRGIQSPHPETHWVQAYTDLHGTRSTHRWEKDYQDIYFSNDFNATLANHYSPYLFVLPFYYGRYKQMVLIYMFGHRDSIRFSQSPNGGNGHPLCPAWDFQYIIRNPKLSKDYGYRSRIVYKPFISQDDVLQEYESWAQTLD